MRVASGKVVGGRVELDGAWPEGASVAVLAREGDETFEVDPEAENMLFESRAQSERGDTIPMTEPPDSPCVSATRSVGVRDVIAAHAGRGAIEIRYVARLIFGYRADNPSIVASSPVDAALEWL